MWPMQTKSALAGKLCGTPSPHTAVRGQGLGATASFATWLPVRFHQSGCSRDAKRRKGERAALSKSACCSCLQQPRSWLMGPACLTLFLVITAQAGRPRITCGLQLWFPLDYNIQMGHQPGSALSPEVSTPGPEKPPPLPALGFWQPQPFSFVTPSLGVAATS